MPTELIVADFFVYAPVPFAKHCLKDTVAYTKGKNKRGQKRKKKLHDYTVFLLRAFTAKKKITRITTYT